MWVYHVGMGGVWGRVWTCAGVNTVVGLCPAVFRIELPLFHIYPNHPEPFILGADGHGVNETIITVEDISVVF